jgi:hypothetical protein
VNQSDFTVGIDSKSEEQTLRGEANGSLPLSGQRSSLFDDIVKPTIIDCEVGENDFATARLGVFTTPGLPTAFSVRSLTADPGSI